MLVSGSISGVLVSDSRGVAKKDATQGVKGVITPPGRLGHNTDYIAELITIIITRSSYTIVSVIIACDRVKMKKFFFHISQYMLFVSVYFLFFYFFVCVVLNSGLRFCGGLFV